MTLDDDQLIVDPASVSPWPIAIRYGLIGGLVYCIYTLIGNMSGLTMGAYGMVATSIVGLLFFAVFIALIVIPVKQHRDKELGGYITIGRVITIGMIVTIIYMLISIIFNHIYMTYIDPDFIETTMNNMEEMMESMGVLSEEQLEEALMEARAKMNPVEMIKSSVMVTTILGLVISGIIGLIMKKDPPRV